MIVKKISMFGVVGVVNTFVDLVVVNVFIFLGTIGMVALPYVVSRSMGFLSAVAVSYVLNQRFVFPDRDVDPFSPLRFLVLTTMTFFVSVGSSSVIHQFIASTGNPHVVGTMSALFGSLMGASMNFIGYNRFVFRKGRASSTTI